MPDQCLCGQDRAEPQPRSGSLTADVATLCAACGQHPRAGIKLLLHYLVLDHCSCNIGTGCEELYGYWVSQGNKTDGWVVQQQKKKAFTNISSFQGEQRSHFGLCSAAHSNESSRSGEFSSYNAPNSTFF